MPLKHTALSASSKKHGDPITNSLYGDLCKLLENDSYLSVEIDDLKDAQQEILNCMNSCAANCSSTCGNNCGGTCKGGCGGSCGGECSSCSYNCGGACSTGCTGDCGGCSGAP